jgi:hypothetical protein
MRKEPCEDACGETAVETVSESTAKLRIDGHARRRAMSEPLRQPPETKTPLRDRLDLCCICTYESECMHRGTPENAKTSCELFDVDVRSLVAHESGETWNGFDQRGDANNVGGLCSNCENRETCSIPVPEGDIWHCEEYC